MSRKYLIAAVLLLAARGAFSQECSASLEGNDLLQFNLQNIDISKSCDKFTINLSHIGKQPRNVMGHNVVIAKSADMNGIAANGINAGLAADYVKAGDARVIAHSKVIGGGETTALTFDVAKLSGAGPYSFFCSYPAHAATMKGTITLKP